MRFVDFSYLATKSIRSNITPPTSLLDPTIQTNQPGSKRTYVRFGRSPTYQSFLVRSSQTEREPSVRIDRLHDGYQGDYEQAVVITNDSADHPQTPRHGQRRIKRGRDIHQLCL
jgi:hypothetical protein